MKKNIILPTVALFVICLVSTLLLALANNVTAPLIADLSAKSEVEARLKVLPQAAAFSISEETPSPEGCDSFVIGLDADNTFTGMVFVSTVKSYGGDLQVMTGIDRDGKVSGIEILQISDTAGLGMNAKKQDFRDRFKGLTDGITVQKNSASPENNEVLALTGATITSNAVAKAVNTATAGYAVIYGQLVAENSPILNNGGVN